MKKRVLYFGLIFFLFLFGCAQKPEKVVVQNVVMNELEGDKHNISFFVTNPTQKIGDCQAKIILNNVSYGIYDLGIIMLGKEKFFETTIKCRTDETVINIIADCRWVTQKEVDSCGDKESIEKKLCMLTLDKPQLQQCLAGNITYYKFFCIALITKDPEICTYIKSNLKEAWCRAYVTGDFNLCENIQNETAKDWCYTDIGINFEDLDICDKISDEKSKTSCTAVAKQQPELCLEGAENYQVSCIVNIIESTENKELCNLLTGEQKEECIKQVK